MLIGPGDESGDDIDWFCWFSLTILSLKRRIRKGLLLGKFIIIISLYLLLEKLESLLKFSFVLITVKRK